MYCEKLAAESNVSSDPANVSSCVAAALYALESAWHPQFDIRTANCRLDFEREENRWGSRRCQTWLKELALGVQFRQAA
jgi:hypothetical protein